jgi:predicted HTH domain antitoxin
MCLYDFTALLAIQGIPVINYDPEDLDRELKNIGVVSKSIGKSGRR